MSFNALAPHYNWMEFILAGGKLQRCRTAFLGEIPAAQNILLMGEGHGRCLIECCRRFPSAKITCVDSSAKMLVEARQQLIRNSLDAKHVEFIHTDVLGWTPVGSVYDLIITNFFLDCFCIEQLEMIISKLAGASAQNANWLIADFQTSTNGFKRIRSQLILGMMYSFFRLATQLSARKLTCPDSILKSAGFVLFRRNEMEWELLHSDWWRRIF